jgi:hypothetical protein
MSLATQVGSALSADRWRPARHNERTAATEPPSTTKLRAPERRINRAEICARVLTQARGPGRARRGSSVPAASLQAV